MVATADASINLSELVDGVLRRWPLILTGSVIGALAAAFMAAAVPVTYQATTTLLVRHSGGVPPNVATAAMRAVIENQGVARQVVQRLKLDQPPANMTAAQLLTHVTVEEVSVSYLLRVRVRFGDPELAARAANAIAEEGQALNSSLNRLGNERMQDLMDRELVTARERMDAADLRLRQLPSTASSTDRTLARTQFETAARLYEEITVQWGKLRLQAAQQNAELLIVDPAVVPASPVAVARESRALFGAVSGFSFSVLAVTLIAYLALLRAHRR